MAASTGGDVALMLGCGVLVVVAVVLAWRWRGLRAESAHVGGARRRRQRTRCLNANKGSRWSGGTHVESSAKRPSASRLHSAL